MSSTFASMAAPMQTVLSQDNISSEQEQDANLAFSELDKGCIIIFSDYCVFDDGRSNIHAKISFTVQKKHESYSSSPQKSTVFLC